MNSRQTVRISPQAEQYPIIIGQSLESEFKTLARSLDVSKVLVVVDRNVAEKQHDLLKTISDAFGDAKIFELAPGEQSKKWDTLKAIIDFAQSHNPDRNTPLFAVGGGVTGDVAGFAASIILRGIPLFHVPTTLLAMVDSAIGGKTGINHETGKNLIGSFYQPKAVFADISTLDTLTDEEFVCGFGEILKYAAISDPVIADILKNRSVKELRENKSQLESIIQRCVKIKSTIVARDTRESGDRAFLNYGHTFAHAMELILGYGTISHGQAVYTGMVAAGYLSEEYGAMLNHEVIQDFAGIMDIDPDLFNFTASDLVEAMKSDKKRKDNNLRFVLLKNYARPYLHEVEEIAHVEEAWNKAVGFFRDQKKKQSANS